MKVLSKVIAGRMGGGDTPLLDLIRSAAEPLSDIADPEFAVFADRFADARVVLLGEASHGTSEFYRARAQITRRLVERHGFNIVAVEADWPDAAAIDRYVRDRPAVADGVRPFQRFPTWMWRNTDVAQFIAWLRSHNETLPGPGQRVGFYGLDLYNLAGSIEAVLEYLDKTDPEAGQAARKRYACLSPWQDNPSSYGRASFGTGHGACETAVLSALRSLLEKHLDYASRDGESFFDAAQNARLVAAAERYYRAMYYASEECWNLRDTHMFETLQQVMAARGPQSKAIVWAHNSHIGNAAATDMGQRRGELNIGQLCREHFGRDAALIGFGTNTGTVAAASDWDSPMEVKKVRPARDDSYEGLCRDAEAGDFFLDLRKDVATDELRQGLAEPRLERAIGVIYRPDTERWSHYFECTLPEQFDAYIWFGTTQAVTPLGSEPRHGMPETYPFGV